MVLERDMEANPFASLYGEKGPNTTQLNSFALNVCVLSVSVYFHATIRCAKRLLILSFFTYSLCKRKIIGCLACCVMLSQCPPESSREGI